MTAILHALEFPLAFLFVLGVLIIVHESGHFLMARWHGVRVVTFSLGFGPKLLKIVRGGTTYCVSAVPLGGYVKLAGETVEDEGRTGAPDEFLSKSKWVRFQVYLMGPVMNILLAIVLLAIVLYRGADVPLFDSQPAFIGTVADDSPAAKSGLRPGDLITSVDATPVPTWDDMEMAVVTNGGREIFLNLRRSGQDLRVPITPASLGKYEIGDLGIGPVMRPQVVLITPGMPAERAGVHAGDVIVGVGGEGGLNQPAIIKQIEQHAKQPVVFHLLRADQPLDVTVVPEDQGGVGKMGAVIESCEVTRIEPGPFRAVGMSVEQNWTNATLIGRTLRGLFTAKTPVKQLMGPLAIADIAGRTAQLGFIPLLGFMAMISLNLGLLNLMPIPVMDGGQIALLAVEGVARRDLSVKVKERVLFAGFAVIVLLMVTAIYNDIARFVK